MVTTRRSSAPPRGRRPGRPLRPAHLALYLQPQASERRTSLMVGIDLGTTAPHSGGAILTRTEQVTWGRGRPPRVTSQLSETERFCDSLRSPAEQCSAGVQNPCPNQRRTTSAVTGFC